MGEESNVQAGKQLVVFEGVVKELLEAIDEAMTTLSECAAEHGTVRQKAKKARSRLGDAKHKLENTATEETHGRDVVHGSSGSCDQS